MNTANFNCFSIGVLSLSALYATALSNKFYDSLKRRTRLEHGRYTGLLQRLRIFVRYDTPDSHFHVGHILLTKKVHDPRHNRVMSARENRQPDKLNVLLQRRIDDLLRGLSQTSKIGRASC